MSDSTAGEYQALVHKIMQYGTPLVHSLQSLHLNTPSGLFSSNLDPDDMKFFLKQQQKLLADSQGTGNEGSKCSLQISQICDQACSLCLWQRLCSRAAGWLPVSMCWSLLQML